MDDLTLIAENPKYRLIIRPWVTNRKTGQRTYPRRARFFRFYVKA